MTRDEVIEDIVRSRIVPRYVNKFCRAGYRDDVVAELYALICEMPEERLLKPARLGSRYLYSYIAGFIKNQLLSSNSSIYRKYTLHQQRVKPVSKIWREDAIV